MSTFPASSQMTLAKANCLLCSSFLGFAFGESAKNGE